LIISTPNKKLRLLPFQKPWNKLHTKEYDCDQLTKVLNRIFKVVKMYGLSASDEIISLERDRVRQKPVDAYVLQPLYRVLGNLPPSARTKLKKMRPVLSSYEKETHASAKEHSLNKMSVNEFVIDSTRSEQRSLYRGLPKVLATPAKLHTPCFDNCSQPCPHV